MRDGIRVRRERDTRPRENGGNNRTEDDDERMDESVRPGGSFFEHNVSVRERRVRVLVVVVRADVESVRPGSHLRDARVRGDG